jgi:hypothetical protein
MAPAVSEPERWSLRQSRAWRSVSDGLSSVVGAEEDAVENERKQDVHVNASKMVGAASTGKPGMVAI